MPCYVWKCRNCGDVEQVIASVAERDDPPPEMGTGADFCGGRERMDSRRHDWERQVTGGQRLMLGPSWGPGKPGRVTR